MLINNKTQQLRSMEMSLDLQVLVITNQQSLLMGILALSS